MVIQAYEEIGENVKRRIDSEPDQFIAEADVSELVEYYFSMDHFLPLQIDRKKGEKSEIKKGFSIPADIKKEEFFPEGKNPFGTLQLFIHIPIMENPSLNGLRQFKPSTIPASEIKWNEDEICICVNVRGYKFEKSDDQVVEEVTEKKKLFYEWIALINHQIEYQNERLRSDIRDWIEIRKQEIKSDLRRNDALIKKINIPLLKKTDQVITKVKLDKSPLIKRLRPNPTEKEEYVLDHKKMLDIVHVLDQQGRQFEKTPKSYKSLQEEDLRNVLLVNLNSVFEGKATGETFLRKGKTDIYLNIDKGNILVCECKIWSGMKLYCKAISQLISYLTWRNNYGIIISFCKQKNLTTILSKAKAAIQSHSSFKDTLEIPNKSHFITNHCTSSDQRKLVEIHHLFYDLYAGS
jgi:hypothetical protein